MSNNCTRCGQTNDPVYLRKGFDSNEEETEIFICNNCYAVSQAQGWLRTESGEIVRIKRDVVSEEDQIRFLKGNNSFEGERLPEPKTIKSSSTNFLMVICVIAGIVFTFAGGFFGRLITDEFSNHESEVFWGGALGCLVGLVIGLVLTEICGVICEILDTLKKSERRNRE